MTEVHIHTEDHPTDASLRTVHFLAYCLNCGTGYKVLANGTMSVEATSSWDDIQQKVVNKVKESGSYPKEFFRIYND